MNFVCKSAVALVVAACAALPGTAQAQCNTCATPVVAYSPVVQQTTVQQGWYLGRFFDRWAARRASRTAVPTTYTAGYAPYSVGYAPYTTAYAPRATYQTNYAPVAYTVARPIALSACSTCSCSPCGCSQQTTFRPVTLAPVAGCSSCQAASPCSSCAGTTTYSYAPAASSSTGCATCQAGYVTTSSYESSSPLTSSVAPAGGSNSGSTPPPQTFRKEPTTAPVEENGSTELGADEASSNAFQAPALWNPRDRVTNNSANSTGGTKIWQAVYRQPVETKQVSQPQPASKPQLKWVSGR